MICGNALHLPAADKSIQTCVTSPPYWGMREYGGYEMMTLFGSMNDFCIPKNPKKRARWWFDIRWRAKLRNGIYSKTGDSWIGPLGLENSLEEYIDHLVLVFREVWRVLRDDGTVWLNLGDAYAGGGRGGNGDIITGRAKNALQLNHWTPNRNKDRSSDRWGGGHNPASGKLKPKDLIGIPWRVAFALQDDGWYLRRDIVWAKPNPMPESVNDRPTSSHEFIFLLSKRRHYFFDKEAIKEPAVSGDWQTGYSRVDPNHKREPTDLMNGIRVRKPAGWDTSKGAHAPFHPDGRAQDVEYGENGFLDLTRNKRDVWFINPQPTREAHFATFPEELATPPILAGTSKAGGCPRCGAPYKRIVSKGNLISVDGTKETYRPTKETDDARIKGRSEGWTPNHVFETKTTGWNPTCKCDAGEPVPQWVLDPFAGSGTVGRVAARYNRFFLGIELNYKYIDEISRNKLTVQHRLTNL